MKHWFRTVRTLKPHSREDLDFIASHDNANMAHFPTLKGLSHEIDFKNFDKNLQNLA